MKLHYAALLATTIILSGCATTNHQVNSNNKEQQPAREREASAAIPLFTGNYIVTDSRQNKLKITSASLSLESEIPVIRFLNAEGMLVLAMKANSCSGDIKNKFTGMAFLACSGKKSSIGGMRNIFSIGERKAGEIKKNGSIFFPDDMVIKDGLLITYYLENERAIPTLLSVRRVP